MMSGLSEFIGHKRVIVLLIALAVALLTIGLRLVGGLEELELKAYDWGMALRPAKTTTSRVSLIGITEEDITAIGGWPMSDATLAEALAKLVSHHPAAVGVDLYRNLPVPPGRSELEEVVRKNPRIVLVKKFGDRSSPGVPAPAFLGEESEQVGFSDMVIDPGSVVRRGLLFLDDGKTVFHSMALRLATLYLADQGIYPQPDPMTPAHIRLGKTTLHPLGPDDGGYAHADTAGYQYQLDFRDQDEALPLFSFADLLADRIDDAALRGRIVVLGTMAVSIHDSFYTPARLKNTLNGMVPGMSLHGHAASQLLRFALDGDQPLASLPEPTEAGWILCWCLLGGVIGLWLRSPFLLPIAAGAGVAVIGTVAVAALGRGLWLPMVPPGLGLLSSAGLVTVYLAYDEAKSRAFLMDMFSRHVSKEVAGSLWQQRRQFMNSGRPLPQRLTATVLFSDLVGFTTISEKLEPPELMEWLNQYMEIMGREVMVHGGIINKYIGDSIMAVFGVPVARSTEEEIRGDAINAVKCAMAMATAMRELNRKWADQGQATVGTRIGIFTGPLVAGSLGSTARMEYTVLGDTVNVASRLESFSKETFRYHPLDNPCRILLGSSTNECLAGHFPTRPVGDIRLKGKDTPVSIYELDSVTTGAT